MKTTETVPARLIPTKRRQLVELGVKAGKSNRAIAKELGVDEGTIRRDRKFLATPKQKRPAKVPLPKMATQKWPVRELSLDERRRRQRQDMHKVVQLWVAQEGLILPDLESFVLPEAGKLLHYHRHSQNRLAVPTKSPDELLLDQPTPSKTICRPS
jgi:transposase-like protein